MTAEVAVAERRSTDPDGTPMLARWGTEHPAAPLVVALHGNGTSEHSLIEIAPWLPHGPVAYVAVRAPIEHGTGYSWYSDKNSDKNSDNSQDSNKDRDSPGDHASASASRVDHLSLAATCRWLLDWLATEGDPDRPVLLVGFREGVTVAGALMLTAPERFAGAMLVYGALPFDTGVPMAAAALAGMPVFLAHGTDDTRTPADLLDRTWEWMATRSGAPVWAQRGPGGDRLVGDVVAGLGKWLGDRLDFVRAHGENPLPDGEEPRWPSLGDRLPEREGDPPRVTPAIPQHQSTQNAPPHLQAALWERIAGLDGVRTAPTTVGADGTRALLLDRGKATGPDAAYVLPADGEFAHQHPDPDGSLHLCLPDALAYDALAKGWAVSHPLAGLRVGSGTVLVPGPRTAAELEVVAGIVAAAHGYACGPAEAQ